jgi:hypothetical protein
MPKPPMYFPLIKISNEYSMWIYRPSHA